MYGHIVREFEVRKCNPDAPDLLYNIGTNSVCLKVGVNILYVGWQKPCQPNGEKIEEIIQNLVN